MILLEKAEILGGTANKAAFWYWVPNNVHMDADPEDGFLRYCARLSRPGALRPRQPDARPRRLGVRRHQGHLRLAPRPRRSCWPRRDALPYRHCEAVPDYWSELPEDEAPTGRVFVPRDARDTMSDGGLNGIRTMSAAAERDGVDVRTRTASSGC